MLQDQLTVLSGKIESLQADNYRLTRELSEERQRGSIERQDRDSQSNFKEWMSKALEEHEARISDVKQQEATLLAQQAAID